MEISQTISAFSIFRPLPVSSYLQSLSLQRQSFSLSQAGRLHASVTKKVGAKFMAAVFLLSIKKGTNPFLFFAVISPVTTGTVGKSYRNTVTGATHLGNAARN